ncbi:MAG: glycosyltransferase [Nanoarchaeota archaeon]
MKIHVIGSFFDSSGYSIHTRNLCNALFQLNPDLSIDTQKPQDWVRYVSDNELKMLSTPYTDNSTTIAITQPQFSPLFLAGNPKAFYQYCVWEGMYCPLFWLPYLSNPRITGVLTPSQHTYNSIRNTIEYVQKQGLSRFKGCFRGIDKILLKTHIIPHGFSPKFFYPKTSAKSNKPFIFLMNKGWSQGINDRGGIQWGLIAFCNEFCKDENVELIVRINPTYNLPNWNLDEEIQKLKLNENGLKKVKFTIEPTTYDKLVKLYHQGNIFVSPTMGDAFNLPCLEAQACGLPIIATNFGGQCDFVNENNGWLINCDLIDVTWDITHEGNKWAKPNMIHLQQTMRYVFEHSEEVKRKGEQALKDSKEWTWEQSTQKLLNITT